MIVHGYGDCVIPNPTPNGPTDLLVAVPTPPPAPPVDLAPPPADDSTPWMGYAVMGLVGLAAYHLLTE